MTNDVEHFFMCLLAIHVFFCEFCSDLLPIFKLGCLYNIHTEKCTIFLSFCADIQQSGVCNSGDAYMFHKSI